MTDEPNSVSAGESSSTPVSTPAPITSSDSLSISEGLSLLNKPRETPPTPNSPAKAEEAVPAVKPSDGETNEPSHIDPVEKPSIDPPNSWTKAEKEAFAALSPEIQQSIADRERARDAEFRRGQNEIAESKKAAESEKQTAEAKRREYEGALPNLLNQLQTLHSLEFQDVKSWDDVQRMAATDPVRFGQWQAAQGKIQAVANEAQAVHQRQQQEASQQFDKWAVEQDTKFLEKAPEFSDPEKRVKAGQEVADYLTKDIGLTTDELVALRDGQASISLRDARAQLIIRDAARYRAAEKARLAAAPRSIPPVQRPGAPAASPGDDRLRDLGARLDRTGSIADALALMNARSAKR